MSACLEVYVSNLDRRSDRWHLCIGAMMALGYPAESIHRVRAHDGDDYMLRQGAYNAAKQAHPDCVYIGQNNMLAKHYFCWAWTWYEMMLDIAGQADGSYHLINVDDRVITLKYAQLSVIASALADARIIQFRVSPPYEAGAEVVNVHTSLGDVPFIRGLRDCDVAIICNPQGARDILRAAEHPDLGIPDNVLSRIGITSGLEGCYCSAEHTVASLNRNHHVDQYDDGRQSCEQ